MCNCVSTSAVACLDHFVMVFEICDISIKPSDRLHTFDLYFGILQTFLQPFEKIQKKKERKRKEKSLQLSVIGSKRSSVYLV